MGEWLLLRSRLSIRGMWRRPLFTILLVGMFSLGIGAATVMFSLLDAIVLKSTPFPSPGQLFGLKCVIPAFPSPVQCPVSAAVGIRQARGPVNELAYYERDSGPLQYFNTNVNIVAESVSSSFFSTLNRWPSKGRWFMAADDDPARRNNLMILSDNAWEDYFARRPDLIGAMVFFKQKPFLICGIMPPDFNFPDTRDDAWVFYPPTLESMQRDANIIVRIDDRATEQELRTDLSSLAQQLSRGNKQDAGLAFEVEPIQRVVLGTSERIVWLLFAAAILFLIVLASSLVNLLVARNAVEYDAQIIRLALGATRDRLIVDFLGEHVFLAIPVAALSLVVADVALYFLQAAGGMDLPRFALASINVREWGYAVCMSLAILVVSGIISLWPFTYSPAPLLGGRAFQRMDTTGTFRWRALRGASVTVQLSIGVLLLVAAASGAGMLWHLLYSGFGFDPGNLLAVYFQTAGDMNKTNASLRGFLQSPLDAVQRLPSVEGAVMSTDPPLGGSSSSMAIAINDLARGWTLIPRTEFRAVGQGYFEVMKIPILRGREFEDGDDAHAPCVAVVSQSFARTLPGPPDPIGKIISTSWRKTSGKITSDISGQCSIVGIVGDVRDVRLEDESRPEVYFSILQPVMTLTNYTMLIRVNHSAASFPLIRETIMSHDSDRKIIAAVSIPDLITGSASHPRVLAFQIFFFAIVAYIVSVASVFAIVTFYMSERKADIGIRLALGAQWKDILGLVAWRFSGIVGSGIAAGIVLAYSSNHILISWIKGLPGISASTCEIAAAVLGISAILACVYPVLKFRTTTICDLLRHE